MFPHFFSCGHMTNYLQFKLYTSNLMFSLRVNVISTNVTGATIRPKHHEIRIKLHHSWGPTHHQQPSMPQPVLTSPLRLGIVLGSPWATLLEGVGGAPAFPTPPPRLFFLRFAPRLASVGLIFIPRNTQTASRPQTEGSRVQCQALTLLVQVKFSWILNIF